MSNQTLSVLLVFFNQPAECNKRDNNNSRSNNDRHVSSRPVVNEHGCGIPTCMEEKQIEELETILIEFNN